MNNVDRLDVSKAKSKAYYVFSFIVVFILAFLFAFPLYWIITGSFKTKQEIMSTTPVWLPSVFTGANFEKLMSSRSAPLFDLKLFGYVITGPTVPAALRWLVNTVFMSVTSMLLTCLTAAMAGYVLAKKRFWGRGIIFSLIVCAIWAVIFPIVGWPFGVFLLKQFAEGIPTEMVEACRIDGASEWRTFTDVMFPMIKPGVGALAIFTFINSWNDYFMQLVMLTSTKNLTISLGIASMQAENSTDFGILMAGSALASVPIIIVFLIFQKYFTKGITMGAVKG